MMEERQCMPASEKECTKRELDMERDFEGLCLAYGAVLVSFWAANPRPAGPGAGLALTASVLLLLADLCVLLWLNAALELVPLRETRRPWLDWAKGALLGPLLGASLLVGVESLKTGSLLRPADAWFYFKSNIQLLHEATRFERLFVLSYPIVIFGIALLLHWGFRKERSRAVGIPPARALLLTVLAATGLAVIGWRFGEARPFNRLPLPEGRLLAQRGSALEERLGRLGRPEPADLLGERIVPFAPPAEFRRLNVVVLMLEAIAWDHPSAWGGPAGVTPNLDALAGECVLFPRAYAASTHSDYAQMAVLSGLYPKKYLTHDFYDAIDYPRTLLWDLLKPCGYATAAFSCQNETWGNMIAFHKTPALDQLWHSPSWPEALHRGASSETKVFEETPVGEWERWRRAHAGTPTVAYLNFQATHFSYEWPPGFPALFAPFAVDFPASFIGYPREKVPVMRNRFFNALHYADRWVGEVVRELKDSGAWDRTVLLVVPDHGQAFYEHGFPTHGTSLHEEQVRTFALLHAPGLPPRVVDEPVSHLDFVPSMLKFLGLPRTGAFQGSDAILDPDYSGSGRPLYFSIQGLVHADGVLLDGWKYMLDWADGTERLYDLGADSGESDDRIGLNRPREELLRDRLLRFQMRQINYYKGKIWTRGYFVPAMR